MPQLSFNGVLGRSLKLVSIYISRNTVFCLPMHVVTKLGTYRNNSLNILPWNILSRCLVVRTIYSYICSIFLLSSWLIRLRTQGKTECRYLSDCVVKMILHYLIKRRLRLYSFLDNKIPRFLYTCIFKTIRPYTGARGSVVVKALCYKPEGRGFETRWGEWFLSNYLIENGVFWVVTPWKPQILQVT
jgi:hypothetical protein